MSRTLDIDKVEAALKRAAHKALHGTREERSGRFLPAKKHGVPSANRTSKPPDLNPRKQA
jgi:hypothetical protein